MQRARATGHPAPDRFGSGHGATLRARASRRQVPPGELHVGAPARTPALVSLPLHVPDVGQGELGAQQPLATDEDRTFFLGTSDYPPFADAVAVMPMISIDTRVLVVIKAEDKGDVEEIKAGLETNIDPTRLVCVVFSMEDVAIESRGDVILMTINTDVEQRTALVEAFQSID